MKFPRGIKGSIRHFISRFILANFNLLSGGMDFLLMHRVRFHFIKWLGVRSKTAPRIGDSFYLMSGKNLKMGSDCVIGHFWKIFDWSPIEIGDNFFASNCLTMVSATHDAITYESKPGPITIGDNVWVGINVTIVGPVNIGNNCVIGAGSVVIKDIPDNAIAAGVPAKVIRFK